MILGISSSTTLICEFMANVLDKSHIVYSNTGAICTNTEVINDHIIIDINYISHFAFNSHVIAESIIKRFLP